MKKLLRLAVSVIMLAALLSQSFTVLAASQLKTTRISRSNAGNPMLGFDENGELLYGGDPSILVDGDTVYAYVGHDCSETDAYSMPDWRCYSSKDMITWKYESIILKNNEIKWADNDEAAWAAQVVKYNDKYYFYYCTGGNYTTGGGMCIGVAVSDSAIGPFKDIGHPLVRNAYETRDGVGWWEDIDPTVWVENVDGEEHRIIGWGNSRLFNAELNEDMISIKDQNNDGIINIESGDIKLGKINNTDDHSGCLVNNDQGITCNDVMSGRHNYTEAPYYYRQQDENGNYYGKYYMFYACDWREQMAYATADTYADFKNNNWQFGGVIQEPSTTSNTNHMAVFDFKGQSYFVYHTGSLPHGSGYRRVACVEPFEINPDGTIDYIKKTATGLRGTAYEIKSFDGLSVAHEEFVNIIGEQLYPITAVSLSLENESSVRSAWVIKDGKSSSSENCVSIESENKPGLYIAVNNINGVLTPVLSQDVGGTEEEAKAMTFKTYEGVNGGVVFESVKFPGNYLVNDSGSLVLKHTVPVAAASFMLDELYTDADVSLNKTKTLYACGDVLNDDDIQITLFRPNGQNVNITSYTTNAADIDMSTLGRKKLIVRYYYNNIAHTSEIDIAVADKAYFTNALRYSSYEASENYNDYLIAAYDFEGNTRNTLDNNDYATVATHTSGKNDVSPDSSEPKYYAGHRGRAIQLGGFGLRLNKKNVGAEYTVSMWVKPEDVLEENRAILFLGYHNPEKWLALAGNNGTYAKFWAKGGQYYDHRNFCEPRLIVNQWNNITVTEKNGRATLYINGVMKSEIESNAPLTTALSDIYIGVNHWDNSFVGLVDDVRVYNKALEQLEIQALDKDEYESSFNDYFDFILSSVNLLGNNKSADSIKYNMYLPTKINDVDIEWESSNPDIVTNSGIVLNPESANAQVQLTATAYSGNLSASRTMQLTVLKLDNASFNEAYNKALGFSKNEYYTKSSLERLNAAIAYAESAITSTEQELAENMLNTAINDLALIRDYTDPFAGVINTNGRSAITMAVGSEAELLTINDSVKDYITVSYSSSDSTIAAYDNGKVNALKAGKAVVSAIVKSAYNGYERRYSIAVNVINDKSALSVCNLIAQLPEVERTTVNDKSAVDYAYSKYNALTASQKASVDFELKQRLDECKARTDALAKSYPNVIGTSGHSYKNVITKATLSANGKITPTCSCGAVKAPTVIYSPKTIALATTNYTYDGKVKTPAVTVKDSKGKTLVKGTDYTVSYASGRKNVGKYAVKITFKGNYSGSKTLYFTIKPKNTSISGITAGSKKFTVKIKKYTTQTTGYQIQYAANTKFTKAKTVTVGNKTTSKTISKLAGKKKYYVRIRTYKTVGGTKYYSAWSKYKAVTTKK